jgi:hypothetical protein
VAALLGMILLSINARAWANAPAVHTAASDGHPTHPVWYHDSSLTKTGSNLVLGWTTDAGSIKVRTWSLRKGSWSSSAMRVSATTLDCGCVDSSGTNPNRHDVPALFTDAAGRVYAMYGGGTASHVAPKTGPYFRAASAPGIPTSWGAEQRLSIPGAMYDIEVVRDNLGVAHLIGQQGDNANGAGSLLYVRMPSGTSTSAATPDPYRVLVAGGKDRAACAWQTTPGCDIYVIGRIALGPSDPANPTSPAALFVTWGWTEKNLSGTCGNPAGFCNHGLYLAESFDGGVHWQNADGSASVDVSSASIAYDDPRFEVVPATTDVGLFKAIAVSGRYPGTPALAYQPDADLGTGSIDVVDWTGSAWSEPTVVDATRGWNDHLVFRSYADGRLALWTDIAQTGTHATELAQWTLVPGGSWTPSHLSVGLNWFLTGRAVGAKEALMWRAPETTGASRVRFTLLREPR